MGQGGAEKIVYQLASGCSSKENKMVVVSCGGSYVEALNAHGISHVQIPDMECKNPLIMFKIILQLIKVIRKEQIDILHSHHRMAAFYGRVLKLFFPKLKLVYTAHNVFDNKIRFTQMALSDTVIVAVGASVKKNLIETFGIAEDRIHTIFNAVSIEEDAAALLENKDVPSSRKHALLDRLKKDGFFLVGLIGRVSEQKGIDVFIAAMEQLVAECSKVKGIIVGDGPLKETMEQLVHDKGLDEVIFFIGYQEDIPSIIAQLDVAAMPSRWEGFPLTPIELFAMGKTLVASNIGGINEIVKDGENGLLVAKEQEKELSDALKLLVTDHELRQQLENQARNDYLEYYSYESFLEEYLYLYHKV